ncbi:MAG: ABC-2 family transporter protein [Spirochaetia bacterium]
MMTQLKIWGIAFKNALASRMAYRIDLFISVFIMLAFELIIPLVTLLIYSSGASFPGWKFHEVFLIQAVFLLSKGITFPFFAGIVWNTITQIREGTYDLLLIKPRNILFMTMLTGIDIEDLGKLLGGIAMFVYAVSLVPDPGALNWLVFVLLFVCSLMVFASFAFIMAASGFKWVGNFRVYEIFEALTHFSMYPMSIFSKGVQILITACIPLALMGFFPASLILGKSLQGLLVSLISSGFFLVFSVFFWYRMLKNYTSAGG